MALTVWTTLRLTLHASGHVEPVLAGATSFPRHWVYDASGSVVEKTGTIGFKEWYSRAAGETGTPWGSEDSPVLVTMAESSLERVLSAVLMRDARPDVRVLQPGDLLTRQGERGDALYVLLDGVVVVEVDGEELAELGPGAVVGERALFEGGTRTATLRAVTRLKVATAGPDAVDRGALEKLTALHRRENH